MGFQHTEHVIIDNSLVALQHKKHVISFLKSFLICVTSAKRIM